MKKSDKTIVIYLYYLQSLLIHKKYVFQAGRKIGGISLWRLLIHDWHKFSWKEFPHYAMQFHASEKIKNDNLIETFQKYSVLEAAPHGELIQERFDLAWLHHENHSPHHWGYWLQPSIRTGAKFSMPETYIREMVADWMGSEMHHSGDWDMTIWMDGNAHYIAQHMTQTTLWRLCNTLNEQYEKTAFDKFAD